jgi:hypothetical protein
MPTHGGKMGKCNATQCIKAKLFDLFKKAGRKGGEVFNLKTNRWFLILCLFKSICRIAFHKWRI